MGVWTLGEYGKYYKPYALRDTDNILQDFNMTKPILVCFNLTAKTSLGTLKVILLDHHMLLSTIPATANW